MKYYPYLFLASISLLAGCEKNKETQPALEGSYQAGAVIPAAAIVLYTSNGRIDNRVVIDNYLARKRNINGYFSWVDVPLPTTYSLTLAFRGNKKVALLSKSATGTDSTITEITSQSAQRLVLANKDSVNILHNATPNRAEQLSDLMLSERPGQRCFPVSVSSGTFSQACRVRPVRVIAIHDGKLFLPQLSWLIQTKDSYGGTVGWAYSGVQNVFNAAAINQLAAGDTLVVQAREIPFSKK